ncbi:MAG TPA: hypothetical protein VKT77_11655 [Chthonomonadaceae bacterium]|nr:hypothetical protein [Chthonomonadaceae bacterium]
MPQYQQLKKGMARVRVLPKDATRAYLLMMKHSGGRLQVLPDDRYEIEEKMMALLTENNVSFEVIEQK